MSIQDPERFGLRVLMAGLVFTVSVGMLIFGQGAVASTGEWTCLLSAGYLFGTCSQ